MARGIRVHAEPPFANRDFTRAVAAKVQSGGLFTLHGLRGAIRLSVGGGGVALVAIRRGADDITHEPLRLSGAEDPVAVVVEMTRNVGEIAVTVERPRREPATGRDLQGDPTLLVIFPEDTTPVPFSRIKSYRSYLCVDKRTKHEKSCEQTLTFGDLPAGRYLVTAIHAHDIETSVDERLLEPLRSRATRVTVEAGGRATVKVTEVPPG